MVAWDRADGSTSSWRSTAFVAGETSGRSRERGRDWFKTFADQSRRAQHSLACGLQCFVYRQARGVGDPCFHRRYIYRRNRKARGKDGKERKIGSLHWSVPFSSVP